MTQHPSETTIPPRNAVPFASVAMRGLFALPPVLRRPRWVLGLLAVLLAAGALGSLPAWNASLRKLLKSVTYADVSRQWFCSLYVRHGVNPFGAANDALERTYGPVQGPDRIRLKDVHIYSANTTVYDDRTPGLLPGLPPPEAGYPPSSLLICMGLFGYLPLHAVVGYWLAVNVLCFLLLIAFWAWPTVAAAPKRTVGSLLFCAGVLAVWPTTRLVFAHGQFTAFSLLAALAGLHFRTARPWLAAALFSLALVKPALVLLFLMVPFLERNWRLFFGIAVLHGLATLAVAWMVRTPPWLLIDQWMNICRYFLQGSFTFQEIYNALGWENTPIQTALTLAFFLYSLWACWIARRARPWLLLGYLCFANLLWTYHERHDFTLLAIPLALGLLEWLAAPGNWKTHVRWAAWVALFAAIGIGLGDVAYTNSRPYSHLLRWLGRGGIAAVFFWLNVELWRTFFQNRRARRPDAA